jgi:hypothetical protein
MEFPKHTLLLMIMRRRLYLLRPGQFTRQILRLVNERRQTLRANPGLSAGITQRYQGNLVFRSFTVQTLV